MSSIVQNSWKKKPFTYSLFTNSKSTHRSPPEKRLHVEPRKENRGETMASVLSHACFWGHRSTIGSVTVKFMNKQSNYF